MFHTLGFGLKFEGKCTFVYVYLGLCNLVGLVFFLIRNHLVLSYIYSVSQQVGFNSIKL